MMFLLLCATLVGSSAGKALVEESMDADVNPFEVVNERDLDPYEEVDERRDVNPFEEEVTVKRCTPEGGMCAKHKSYGRCEYDFIAAQCPCTCGSDSSDDDSNDADNSSGLSKGEQTILDEHNKRRRMHGVSDLAYDTNLADSAKAWCNTLAQENAFYHSDQSNNVERVGENLYYAMGYPEKRIPGIAVKRWYDEIELWDYNNPKFSGATGHFTQVVWKDTKRLGCGVTKPADNAEEKVFVCCHYSPNGNKYGQYADQVPRPTL